MSFLGAALIGIIINLIAAELLGYAGAWAEKILQFWVKSFIPLWRRERYLEEFAAHLDVLSNRQLTRLARAVFLLPTVYRTGREVRKWDINAVKSKVELISAMKPPASNFSLDYFIRNYTTSTGLTLGFFDELNPGKILEMFSLDFLEFSEDFWIASTKSMLECQWSVLIVSDNVKIEEVINLAYETIECGKNVSRMFDKDILNSTEFAEALYLLMVGAESDFKRDK